MPALTATPTEGLRVQRLAWAGVQLTMGAVSLFVDPWISSDIWDGTWRDPIPPLESATPARFVLVTHLHNDHFDRAAIGSLLADAGSVVCDARHAAAISAAGFRVRPVDRMTPAVIGEFTVTPVGAEDGLGEDQVSWIIRAGGTRLIHAGDTLWHGRWRALGRQHGPFDVAFLPINGARIPALLPEGARLSMSPIEALNAAALLEARTVVPIHFGADQPGEYEEIPGSLDVLRAEAERRGQAIAVLEPGEWLDFDTLRSGGSDTAQALASESTKGHRT